MSTSISSEADTPTPVPTLPDLAKMPAVKRLANALEERGLRSNTAEAIAVAVCDPSEARRQLEQPATMRVSGGTLAVLYTDVWVPAVLPYPDNPRMLPGLTYAVESHEGRRRPLPPARASNGASTELVMAPVRSTELVDHLDAQFRYLRDNNDLALSVGDHGIQEPLLLVPLAFEGSTIRNELSRDLPTPSSEEEWPTILTSVDGNSRLAAAYRHLRMDPGEMVTKLLGNPRAIRQRVGNTLALQRPSGSMSAEAEEALRVISAPAAIIINFTPTDVDRDLGHAIQSRLGALHVAPPKPWNPASKYDLLLNVSLEALQPDFDAYATSNRFSGAEYREWLAGNLAEHEASDVGLDTEVDFRAVALRWWFRDRDADVSAAIRRLDITGNVTPAMRANIAAEGALRSFRSQMSATEADNARRVLAALYQLEDLDGVWDADDSSGVGPLSAAVRAATAEISAAGRPGPRARLLMQLAFYWMARYKIVPLQTRGGQTDRRKITEVITLMCRTEHGIRVLGQVIKDGRNGVEPRIIGVTGKLETKNGKPVPLTDDWIRQTWSTGRPQPPARSPHQDLQNRSQRLAELVHEVSGALSSLREPLTGDGLPLVETVGLELSLANKILAKLDDVRDDILELRLISKRANRQSAHAEDDA